MQSDVGKKMDERTRRKERVTQRQTEKKTSHGPMSPTQTVWILSDREDEWP